MVLKFLAIIGITIAVLAGNFYAQYGVQQERARACQVARVVAETTLRPLDPIRNPDPVSLAQNLNANRQKAARLKAVQKELDRSCT